MTSQLISYREALRCAHRSALLRDKRVFLMGEDVGAYGGCYAVSKGLLQEFGAERILQYPPFRKHICWCWDWGGIRGDATDC